MHKQALWALLEMLIEQGAKAFEIWTGLSAPRDAMKRNLLGILVSRYDGKKKGESDSTWSDFNSERHSHWKGIRPGISLKVTAEVELQKGHGLRFITGRNGDRLIKNIIQKTIPKETIESNMISIRVDSEIPIGYGLKSSSAVSNAIVLACSQIAREEDINDNTILEVLPFPPLKPRFH